MPKFVPSMNVVATLEARYLPLLNQAAARLGKMHPTFKFNVGSGSVGGATAFQGHQAYLEAFRPESADPEPNCLALEICVQDLPGTPTLCALGVTWGGDGISPSDGLDLLPADVVFEPDALRVIDEALPRLEDHFDRCLCDWEAAYPKST
jgi:hypothetical protein